MLCYFGDLVDFHMINIDKYLNHMLNYQQQCCTFPWHHPCLEFGPVSLLDHNLQWSTPLDLQINIIIACSQNIITFTDLSTLKKMRADFKNSFLSYSNVQINFLKLNHTMLTVGANYYLNSVYIDIYKLYMSPHESKIWLTAEHPLKKGCVMSVIHFLRSSLFKFFHSSLEVANKAQGNNTINGNGKA